MATPPSPPSPVKSHADNRTSLNIAISECCNLQELIHNSSKLSPELQAFLINLIQAELVHLSRRLFHCDGSNPLLCSNVGHFSASAMSSTTPLTWVPISRSTWISCAPSVEIPPGSSSLIRPLILSLGPDRRLVRIRGCAVVWRTQLWLPEGQVTSDPVSFCLYSHVDWKRR